MSNNGSGSTSNSFRMHTFYPGNESSRLRQEIANAQYVNSLGREQIAGRMLLQQERNDNLRRTTQASQPSFSSSQDANPYMNPCRGNSTCRPGNSYLPREPLISPRSPISPSPTQRQNFLDKPREPEDALQQKRPRSGGMVGDESNGSQTPSSQRTLDFDDLPTSEAEPEMQSPNAFHLHPILPHGLARNEAPLTLVAPKDIPTSSISASATANEIIVNPFTLAGQQTGALLTIQRHPSKIKKVTKGPGNSMVMEVGDVVKVLHKVSYTDANGKDYLDYAVENMRTGARVIVAWSTFLPVGIRELCDCRGQRCRCEYVDWPLSQRFAAGN